MPNIQQQLKAEADKIKETPLSKQIKEALDALGVENERLQSGKVLASGRMNQSHWMQLCKAGTPDRLAIVQGFAIFIEVKTKGKEPTAEQKNRQRQLAAAGAFIINADSLDDFTRKFLPLKAKLNEVGKTLRQLL